MLSIFLLGLLAVTVPEDSDADRDGVSDSLEASLIERFRPFFHVSETDCAELPAEFEAFSVEPRVRARNATLYARVSPSRTDSALEIHYYHLWERDCGPLSPHDLDVEHVSALVAQDATGEWRARYWYAAAHEDTLCDTSNAARAEAVGAVASGPDIWISRGKHASYLSRELCGQRGCGVDDCRDMVPLPLEDARLTNIGERGTPLSGSTWMASRDWKLEEKLGSDFDPELVAQLESSEDPEKVLARVNGHWRATQFSLSIGGDALGALGQAGNHGGGSLVEAEQQTESALGKTFRAVGRALGRVIGMGGSDDDDETR